MSNTLETGSTISDGVITVIKDLLLEWKTERGLLRTAGLTVSEIHGHVHIHPALASTGGFTIRAAAGIGFFPDTLSSAIDYPDPLLDHWGWQSIQTEMAQWKFEAAGTTTIPTPTPSLTLDMHTKAMRKQPSMRSDLALLVRQDNSSSVQTVQTSHLRMLVLLP